MRALGIVFAALFLTSCLIHASPLGMVAGNHGFHHPDWNKVTNFMGGKKQSGKDRASGHFGFTGHNDPVMFRNISDIHLD